MALSQKTNRRIGLLVGVALLGGGVIWAAFFRTAPASPEDEPIVRPLKTLVVGDLPALATRNYPARVRPNQQVELAFQVAGQLIEFPVRKGLPVNEGDVIARLDTRDFESALQAKRGVYDKAAADLEKVQHLAERGVSSAQEVIDAKAAYDVAEAELKIAEKALADATLIAPFSGVVADTYVDNFENVQAKQRIVSLQDITEVEIETNVPESRLILAPSTADPSKARFRFVAVFENLPQREFDLAIKEYATDADPLTQTYRVTFVMPAPQDARILPGMTATIQEIPTAETVSAVKGVAVPLSLVPVDGVGQYYVWKIETQEGGDAVVRRVNVSVGGMIGDTIVVTDGLSAGERIAAAGVSLLNDGQRVRPLN